MKLPGSGTPFWQAHGAQPVSSAAACLQASALQMFVYERLKVLDLGCGSGILSVMMALNRPRWQILGIDIQPELIALARQNAAAQNLAISFECADLRSFHSPQAFDLIVSNPPWLKSGHGKSSADPSREFSRREITCQASDIAACLKRNLHAEGSALLLYPKSRKDELEELFSHYFLDTIQASPCPESNKFMIYHVKQRG